MNILSGQCTITLWGNELLEKDLHFIVGNMGKKGNCHMGQFIWKSSVTSVFLRSGYDLIETNGACLHLKHFYLYLYST